MGDKVKIITDVKMEDIEETKMSKKELKQFHNNLSGILKWFVIGLLCGVFLFIVFAIKYLVGLLK